jgi:hypothetical protein
MSKFVFTCMFLGLFSIFTILGRANNLVQFPKENASWSVVVTQTAAPAPPPLSTPAAVANAPVVRKVKSVEVTQVDAVKRIHILWSDNKETEKWALAAYPVLFEEDPRNGAITPVPYSSLQMRQTNFDLSYDSFSFDWLTPETLQEKDPVSYLGKKCYHYKGTVLFPEISGTPGVEPIHYKREAWIDIQTLLPVALDSDTSHSVFTFSDKPPTGPLPLPSNFKQSIGRYKLALGLP